MIGESLCLKVNESTPMFILTALRTSLLLPENVGPFPKMLITRPLPVFFRAPIRASVFLPEQVCALPHSLVQSAFRFRIALDVVAVRSHLTAAINMLPGFQGAKFSVGYEPAVGCRFERLSAVLRIVEGVGGVGRLVECDWVRVQHGAVAVYYINQALVHDWLPGVYPFNAGARRFNLSAIDGAIEGRAYLARWHLVWTRNRRITNYLAGPTARRSRRGSDSVHQITPSFGEQRVAQRF
ncbi:hypothetical protein BYI23_D016490 (plasmid) [Burkholderia sp. YI23]|nr:hypothetical protein BYI23_D013460 [Burkholderia sp. YI23]AET95159.1 hypothetical protein BYI23_D016490 [Burkholderia sp. YI23]